VVRVRIRELVGLGLGRLGLGEKLGLQSVRSRDLKRRQADGWVPGKGRAGTQVKGGRGHG